MSDLQPGSMRVLDSRFSRSLCGALLLAACFACGGGAGTSDAVTPLVAVTRIDPLPGDVSSQATAVSADGAVVVGISKSASGKAQAFRWSALEGLTGLGFMAKGTFSSARAVSADGTVVVGDGDAQDTSSAVFRWSAGTGPVQLKALANPNTCAAAGVSGDGKVVVGTCLITGNAAFRWTESTGMVSLGQFGGGSNRTSNALAISSDASTIVGIGHPVMTGAVLWSSSGESSILGWLPGDISAAANAVSRDGSVVVGYSTEPSSHQRLFRWTRQTGMTAIDAPAQSGLSDVFSSAVSGDGGVIVGWGNTANGETAVIWDESHGMRRLEDMLKIEYQTSTAAGMFSRATGISDDGRTIVGFGVSSDGHTEGWVLKLPN